MRGRNLLDAVHNEFRFPIIIALVILLFVNASGKINIDLMLDRTPQENLNIFLNDIDNMNPVKVAGNEEKTGINIYDENRILYNTLYKMGQKEYLVYVFTKDTYLDNDMNTLLNKYKTVEDGLNVYALSVSELENTFDSHLIESAPFVMKLTRDNSVSGEEPVMMTTGLYNTVEEFNDNIFNVDENNVGIEETVNEKEKKKEKKKEQKNDVVNDKTDEGNIWENLFREDSFLGKLFKDGKLR